MNQNVKMKGKDYIVCGILSLMNADHFNLRRSEL